ncbi:MAG: PQQ-binding-like beta-propeller repeat protein [Bacteroidales bacterium]|nr:PQQ-binding-like beta-propeller repeat protein [Bacteroidales bacterium]
MLKRKKQILSDEGAIQKPLRLRPGVVIVMIQWLLWLVIPVIFPGTWIRAAGVLGGIFGGVVVIVWWAFFSRAPLFERWGAIVLWIFALFVAYSLTHESITTGMQGMMFYAYALPVLSLAFVIWAVTSRNLSGGPRRVTMVTTILLACGVWTLFRSDGMTGDASALFAWRWSETHEERLLFQTDDEQMSPETSPEISETEAEWPGFRGGHRNSIIQGMRIETDWSTSPPVELWRRPIGPGCSSFAVRGNLLYTQEQRGDDEVVACYNLTTGEPVWRHHDEARFWDSHAGAGPRSTPTLSDGRLYTLGATGILNVLYAVDGSVVWSCNAASDTKVESPGWGFTSSPLVVDDVVIVAIAGKLAAYDIATGNPRWFGPEGGESYSSPHLFSIDGVAQVLMMNQNGATSFLPVDGKILWEHPWPGAQIVQPAMCANGDIMISAGNAKGICRIAVALEPEGWAIEERWTSFRLKPNFNDFVVHEGHAYGFEGPSLACIDLEDGKRMWKGGRYGGQILLLSDQDMLLVLSEKGELVLVEAVPAKLTELERFPAIEGKTWNHPALVGDILLVRNTQEMVAFRLPLAGE